MPEIKLRVTSDADTAALDTAGSKVDTLRGKLEGMALPAAAVAGALTAGAGYVTQFASEAQQAVGGVETVFGSYAAEVQRAAGAADQALGLSEAAYNSLATNVGGSLKAAGFAQDELGGKTDDLITRAADLASVFGGTTTDATGAMGAALRGEFDSLEQFGVFLNAAAVEAELARTGQDKLTGAALDAAKKQATYNLIMAQSADYAGNFAREADTAAGAEQRAAAARENAAAALGSSLLPAWTTLNNLMATGATWISQHTGLVLGLAGVLGTAAAVVLGLNAAMRVAQAVQAAWAVATRIAAAAQMALNAAMAMNPIALIIIAVVALVALFVTLYARVEWFRNGVNAAASFVTGALSAAGAAIAARWSATTSAISAGWSAAMAFINAAMAAVGAYIGAALAGVSAAWSALSSTASALWSAAMASINAAIAAVGSTVRGILSSVASGWRTTSSAASSAWRTAMSAAGTVSRNLGSTVSSIMSSIGRAIRTAIAIVVNLGSTFRSASGAATGALNSIIGAVQSVISWVSRAIDKVGFLKSIGSGIASVFGGAGWVRPAVAVPADGSPFYMTAALGTLLPAIPLADSLPTAGPSRVVRVNVYGAVDPNRTARQIKNILDRDERRDGGDDLWT